MAGIASRRPVRIRDVARLAGVATSTASKALNGTGQLRAETRERVRRAADQLGFTPDSLARALTSGRSRTVGLVTSDMSGRFSIPIMLGAEDALTAGEMALMLCDTRGDPVRERHYVHTLLAHRVDGIIVTGRRTEPRPPIDVPVPVVYAFGASTDPRDASVISDDHAGSAAAVTHLLATGRRAIAHLTGPERHRSATVRAGAAVETAGATFRGPPLFGEWSEQWGRQGVDLLLHAHPDLDAVSCGSDQIARGACDRLRELGRRIPGDVAVTGYDDWDVMALACRPPLTTVDLGLADLGRTAARMLLNALAGDPEPGLVELPGRLVIRESTVSAG